MYLFAMVELFFGGGLLYPLRSFVARPPARGDSADSLASMFSMQIFPCR